MRDRNNYLPEIEAVAEDLVRRAGYVTGAPTHSAVERTAADLGFSLLHVNDLPHSTRTVTDPANGRIYLPPASVPGGHGLRSLALQAIAHRVLAHSTPRSYADFLRQRVEITYFAAACLVPRTAALAHLTVAKRRKSLAVEDLRDAFGVTHEAAAGRLTNLLTEHLDSRLHFLWVGAAGTLFKGLLPGPACCRQPDPTLATRWAPHAWPSAAVHAHVLSPQSTGSPFRSFPPRVAQ